MALYKHSLEFENAKLTQERINQITMESITDREFEILQDILSGQNNAQISSSRQISMSTVKFHISNLFQKMEVKNRADALHKIIKMLT